MTETLGRHFNGLALLKFTFPTIVMMIFMSLYTIIDGMFVSRFVGSNALSSVNIVYPFYGLVFAIGIMFATGGSALIAQKLGEGKTETARSYFSLFIGFCFILGTLLALLGNLFMTPIVHLLGASDVLVADCKIYLSTLLYFAPAAILQVLFQTYFVTAGKPHLGMVLTIIAGVTNAILDFVFIVLLKFGIQGAALATGIGQLIPTIIGLIYFSFVKKGLYFVIPKWEGGAIVKACINGSSEMVSNLALSITTYLFNLMMLRLAGEDGVAAITIVLYGQFLFSSLYLGFSMGAAPIISYNYGSQNQSELQNVTKLCKHFIIASSILITVLAASFSKIVVRLFVPLGSNTYDLAAHGFLLFALSYLFQGYNIFASSLFTALSNGKTSALISFIRTFLFIIVSLFTLPFLIGIDGIWLAIPVAELAAFILSLYCIKKYRCQYHY